MAFESGSSSPNESQGRKPESIPPPSNDVRVMLPKKGQVLNEVRQMRSKISGIFSAVNPSQNSDK